ncbi:phage baseplate assembly protein V [Haliangium sp.]|uniref:phage baseplate assembly protein V n=1 Tax=Haliangium sp. TaxID=2663208 RepID=UPI003D134E2F
MTANHDTNTASSIATGPQGAMRFFGKYRGVVTDDADPTMRGRVKVRVPAVTGAHEQWAMPCVPYAGQGVGLFAVPPKGANVWVEFEGGDPDAAIVAGCFWGPGEAPILGPQQFIKAFVTESFALIMDEAKKSVQLSITPGGQAAGTPVLSAVIDPVGVTVESQPGSMTMTKTGLELGFGSKVSIKLAAAGVAINRGRLAVKP